MAEPLTWETLRSLCAEAGITEEFTLFEEGMRSSLCNVLLDRFGMQSRYLTDHRFRVQVNELVWMLVHAITQRGVEPHQTTDMDELRKIFKNEVKGSTQSRGNL